MERKVYPPMPPLSRSELREGWREGGREGEEREEERQDEEELYLFHLCPNQS